jgi:hypothetical protein
MELQLWKHRVTFFFDFHAVFSPLHHDDHVFPDFKQYNLDFGYHIQHKNWYTFLLYLSKKHSIIRNTVFILIPLLVM